MSSRMQRAKQPDDTLCLGGKAKEKSSLEGMPTKQRRDDGSDFKMLKSSGGPLNRAINGKTGKQNFPPRDTTSKGIASDSFEKGTPRLLTRYTEYIARLRSEIENCDPEQLLARFEEVEPIYRAYKKFVAVPLLCEICDVRTNEVEPLLEHYKCSRHRRNIENPHIRKFVDFDEYFRRLELMSRIVASRRKGIYECELCSLTFTRRDKYVVHKRGKRHESNLYRSYCAVVIANAAMRTNRSLRL